MIDRDSSALQILLALLQGGLPFNNLPELAVMMTDQLILELEKNRASKPTERKAEIVKDRGVCVLCWEPCHQGRGAHSCNCPSHVAVNWEGK